MSIIMLHSCLLFNVQGHPLTILLLDQENQNKHHPSRFMLLTSMDITAVYRSPHPHTAHLVPVCLISFFLKFPSWWPSCAAPGTVNSPLYFSCMLTHFWNWFISHLKLKRSIYKFWNILSLNYSCKKINTFLKYIAIIARCWDTVSACQPPRVSHGMGQRLSPLSCMPHLSGSFSCCM